MNGFDVIGDVHGYAPTLKRLLAAMGYREQDGVYRHPSRVAVFLGDLIDRGPQQAETLRLARAMVEAGTARAVMGNHEFNAIAYATADDNGGFLRRHDAKNHRQHRVFLDEVGEGSSTHAEAIGWFNTLPLWLDLGGLRVIHACWRGQAQQALAACLDDDARLSEPGLREANRRDSPAYAATELLLKGPEVRLPEGRAFHDKDGHLRDSVRLRWWDPGATTWRRAALGMAGAEADLPDAPIPPGYVYAEATPVLFGHYWMRGEPRLLHPRASCLDFSVAASGCLAAYRWSGEAELNARNLVWVAA